MTPHGPVVCHSDGVCEYGASSGLGKLLSDVARNLDFIGLPAGSYVPLAYVLGPTIDDPRVPTGPPIALHSLPWRVRVRVPAPGQQPHYNCGNPICCHGIQCLRQGMFDWDSRARHGYEVDAEDLGAPLVPSEDDACVGRNGFRDSETSGKKTSNPPVSQDSNSQLLTSSASFLAPPATDLTKLAYNTTVVGSCTPDVPHTATHVAPVSNSPSEPEHGVQHNLPLHDDDGPYGDKTSVVAQVESPDPGLPCE